MLDAQCMRMADRQADLVQDAGALPEFERRPDAAKLEASRKSGVPVPAVHSPLWTPEREPTIKAAITAETAILIDVLNGS